MIQRYLFSSYYTLIYLSKTSSFAFILLYELITFLPYNLNNSFYLFSFHKQNTTHPEVSNSSCNWWGREDICKNDHNPFENYTTTSNCICLVPYNTCRVKKGLDGMASVHRKSLVMSNLKKKSTS